MDQSKRDLFHNRPRVLIVEDDLGIRYAYERHLRSQGINTTIASTGREALALLDALEVDAVLLDLKLPDIRGEEVLDYLRARGGLHRPPAVVVVAGVAPAASLDVDAQFEKPAAPEEVCAKLLELIFRG